MKLSFEKDHLMNGINIVLKAVPSKTTMPILECILIDAVSDEIKLTGNDMELGIETKVEGTILERGKIALDAKLFPILSASSPAKILRSRSNRMKNTTRRSPVTRLFSRFRARMAMNFPIFPTLSGINSSHFPSLP